MARGPTRNEELESTLPEESLSASSPESTQDHLAFFVCAAPGEPRCVGLSAVVERGQTRILGRGPASPDDPAPRLAFVAWREFEREPAAPLLNPHLSRVQMRVRASGDALHLENLGRLPLRINGIETRTDASAGASRAVLGDVLELGSQLLLVIGRRRVSPEAPSADGTVFPFGQSDSMGFVGESQAMWTLRRRVAFVAARSGHVLIRGPSGSGKELVARALHAQSARAHGPLVARNAATIPDGLIDAELFGNARNYPNAGLPDRPGLVGEAHGGTLFLDEFAELPESAQVHLLRVLDGGEYQRLGEARSRTSTFRLVAATNRPVSALRHDVEARFSFPIEVPDLDARREDIPLLVRHLLGASLLADPTLRRTATSWVGEDGVPRVGMSLLRDLVSRRYTTNVRELSTILWRAIESTTGAELELRSANSAPMNPCTEAALAPEQTTAADDIQRCLDEHNGMIEETWRALGLANRHVLARLIRKHGLEVRRRTR